MKGVVAQARTVALTELGHLHDAPGERLPRGFGLAARPEVCAGGLKGAPSLIESVAEDTDGFRIERAGIFRMGVKIASHVAMPPRRMQAAPPYIAAPPSSGLFATRHTMRTGCKLFLNAA